MDNLAHSLIGLAASKAGLERLSPATSALCLIAANAPDGDVVVGLVAGRWAYLQHHRGLTHSIAGALAIALLLPLVFYLGDILIARVRKRATRIKVRGLLIASLVVTATHPFMDWTNNYGLRPWLPWSSQWFYGDFVFIIDPVFWLLLGGAAFLVTSKTKLQLFLWSIVALIPGYVILFVAANRVDDATAMVFRILWIVAVAALIVLFKLDIGIRWKSKIPLTALGLVSVYLVGLFLVHEVALRRARVEAATIAAAQGEKIVDVAAMPAPANPLTWLCVVETERAAYRFELSLVRTNDSRRTVVRHQRLEAANPRVISPALSDHRAQIFLGFARFPVVRILGEDCATQTLVQLADLRYTEPGSDRGTFALELPVECTDLTE